MSNTCNTYLQQCQNHRTAEGSVSYRATGTGGPCSRRCTRDHSYCNPAGTAWLNNNNDPLQDYIRRTLSGHNNPVIRRTSTQRYMSQLNGTSRRPYLIIPSQARYTSSYQPYLQHKRQKCVFIKSNGFMRVIKNQADKTEDISPVHNNLVRLDFIEQYIIQNTNPFGYVTLNEIVLKELGIAISDCMSKRVTVSETPFETNIQECMSKRVTLSATRCETIYEPISPAENSDDNED